MKLQLMKIIVCHNAQEKKCKKIRKGGHFPSVPVSSPFRARIILSLHLYTSKIETVTKTSFGFVSSGFTWSCIIYGSILSSDILLEDKCGFTDLSRVQCHLSCNDSEIHAMLNNISNVDNTAIAAHVMCAYLLSGSH
jgi:hypothetical protein